MPVEVKVQRREKLSLRKELKRKCQEICVASSTPQRNMEVSQRAVVVQENSHVLEPDCGENGFIATITSEFPRGYCIETQINGKLLRGLVFFKNPSISGEFLTTIAGRIRATDSIIRANEPRYQAAASTANINQMMNAELASNRTVLSQEPPIKINTSGLDKLASSSKNKDS